MTKECIICGDFVNVPEEAEIVSCGNEHCDRIIEDSIGLHYTEPKLNPENLGYGADGSLIYI